MEDDAQTRANTRMWSRTDLVPNYAHRDVRAVETTILVRYRDDLAGRVLELGCGAGRLTGHLLEIANEVHAIDVSPTMLRACVAAYPEVHGEVGDIRDLSAFADQSYDAIVAGFGLLDVLNDPERRAALAQLRRILVPGGLLVFSSHNRDAGPDRPAQRCRKGMLEIYNLAKTAPRWMPNRWRLTRQEREEAGYAIYNDSSHDYGALHYYITRDEQEKQLAEAGFALLECLDLAGFEVKSGQRSMSSELHYLAR